MVRSSLRTTCQPSAWVKRGLTVNTPCCANAIASCSGRLLGSAPRLAARNTANAGGGIHLPGAGPVEDALLVAGLADRMAVDGVALHRALPQRRRDLSARVGAGHRHRGRGHAERRQQALLQELPIGHVEAA